MATEISINPAVCCVVACPVPTLDAEYSYEIWTKCGYEYNDEYYLTKTLNYNVLDDGVVSGYGEKIYTRYPYLSPCFECSDTETIDCSGRTDTLTNSEFVWSTSNVTTECNTIGSVNITLDGDAYAHGWFPYNFIIPNTLWNSTGPITTTYTNLNTDALFESDNRRRLALEPWVEDDWFSIFPLTALLLKYNNSGGNLRQMRLQRMRYRVEIPETFCPPPIPAPQKWHGTKQVIILEETFTPADHDPENPTVSPIVVAEKTVTWTGPGTIGEEDSWKTAWVEVNPPANEGKIVVAIKKWRCYTNGPWHS